MEPAGFLLWQLATEAHMSSTGSRPVAKSDYTQHRRGAIVWVHNKVQPHHTIPQHQAEWERWVDQVATGTAGMKDAAVIGEVNEIVRSWMANNKKAPLATNDIVATRSRIQHILSEWKASKGRGVGLEAIKGLPTTLANPKAILWDKEDPSLIYVYEAGDTVRQKFVVRVNFTEKGMGTLNSLRSGGLVDSTTLNLGRYLKISGNP
jgi:hypothetical protein